MKKIKINNIRDTLKRKILFVCVAIIAAFLIIFISVIFLQYSNVEVQAWDLQSATTVAAVVPSITAVLLAAWSIYYQVKANSPSHKKAQTLWLKISDLHQRALMIGDDISNMSTEEPESSDHKEVGEICLAHTLRNDEPIEIRKNEIREAQKIWIARCGCEFKFQKHNRENREKTFAELVADVRPVLDKLQNQLNYQERFSFFKLQVDIDAAATGFDHDDYPDASQLVNEVQSILKRIIYLIEALQKQGLLEVENIEAAILEPAVVHSVREWITQVDLEKARASGTQIPKWLIEFSKRSSPI